VSKVAFACHWVQPSPLGVLRIEFQLQMQLNLQQISRKRFHLATQKSLETICWHHIFIEIVYRESVAASSLRIPHEHHPDTRRFHIYPRPTLARRSGEKKRWEECFSISVGELDLCYGNNNKTCSAYAQKLKHNSDTTTQCDGTLLPRLRQSLMLSWREMRGDGKSRKSHA
jgi:hypothetical protein